MHKVPRQAENYPDYLKIFQQLRKFPDAPEMLEGHSYCWPLIHSMRKKFPDAQLLSGEQRLCALNIFMSLQQGSVVYYAFSSGH